MNLIAKINSCNDDQTDCFGNKGIFTTDHIYPKSFGGSDSRINLQTLCQTSNKLKRNLTKGKIGEWKFAIIKRTTKEGIIYGQMYIRHKDWAVNDWAEVVPTVLGNDGYFTNGE